MVPPSPFLPPRSLLLSRLTACLLLLLATVIWGTTFVAQKWVGLGDNAIGSLAFTGGRFLLGGLVVAPLAWREARHATRPLSATHWLGFLACGVLLLLGAWTQQLGIRGTTIGNAGFLTGLYVAQVPLLSWGLFGQKPHRVVWPAMALCLAGAWLLTGADLTSLSAGDRWILLCSVFWALHMTLIGVLVTTSGRPLTLACVQFLVTGLLGSLSALVLETPTLAAYGAALGELIWAGCLSAGIAFTLQVVAQRHLHPATAAIIMSAESVFAALSGALVLDERMTPVQMVGATLILMAILAVEGVPAWDARRDAARRGA
jgi:drug/metabolite transporter (DMT)-like permease